MSSPTTPRPWRWPEQLDPGPADWSVLDILWSRGPSTAQEVSHAIAQQGRWSPGAAPALLARLLENGLVRYEDKRKRPLHVMAAVSRAALREELCRRFAQRHFGEDLHALEHCVQRCVRSRSGSSSSEMLQSSNAQG